MREFEFRVYDCRCPAPSVMLVLTRDEASAREMAERTLRQTEGCSRIDVWVARAHLFTVEAPRSLADRGPGCNDAGSRSSIWSAFRRTGLRLSQMARSTIWAHDVASVALAQGRGSRRR